MRTINNNIFLFFTVLGLTACGGGSSSGGAQGGPAPTAFAGTYEGQMTFSAQGFTEATAAVIVVDPMGRVTLDLPNEDPAECIVDPTPTSPFLAGDRINFSESGTCFDPELGGTCELSIEGQVLFSTTNAVGDGTFQIMCPVGNLNGTLGIGATKVS